MWKTEREREVVELYSEDLRRLTFNSRPVISNLSELANEYRREFSHLIVKLIEDRIRQVRGIVVPCLGDFFTCIFHQVPQDQKLPHLYLLDSIVKNHSEPYVILFQQNIVTTFALVFANSSYDDRKALLKLRNTWNNLFTFTKLNQLDKKIKTLDPAWPIQLPRRDQAAPAAPTKRIHVNPAVFGRSQPEPSAAEEELRKKALELERLRKEKEELEMLCKQRELDRELELARKQVEEQRALVS